MNMGWFGQLLSRINSSFRVLAAVNLIGRNTFMLKIVSVVAFVSMLVCAMPALALEMHCNVKGRLIYFFGCAGFGAIGL